VAGGGQGSGRLGCWVGGGTSWEKRGRNNGGSSRAVGDLRSARSNGNELSAVKSLGDWTGWSRSCCWRGGRRDRKSRGAVQGGSLVDGGHNGRGDIVVAKGVGEDGIADGGRVWNNGSHGGRASDGKGRNGTVGGWEGRNNRGRGWSSDWSDKRAAGAISGGGRWSSSGVDYGSDARAGGCDAGRAISDGLGTASDGEDLGGVDGLGPWTGGCQS